MSRKGMSNTTYWEGTQRSILSRTSKLVACEVEALRMSLFGFACRGLSIVWSLVPSCDAD